MMLADISVLQFALIAVVSFLAGLIGGISGYGTGLLLPPILLPIVGPVSVIPIVSLSALLTNASRLLAFWKEFERIAAIRIAIWALPGSVLGAYAYTLLSGPGVAALVGAVLIVLVPTRHVLMRSHGQLAPRGVMAASAGYGLLNGGTSGSGVVLLTILLAAGLNGSAVIATDAGVSLVLGIAKTVVFQSAGSLELSGWIIAGIVGLCASPGAVIAKKLTARLPANLHSRILDAVVVLGGGFMMVESLRGL
jgi:uncharacterized membrane protein YfcA